MGNRHRLLARVDVIELKSVGVSVVTTLCTPLARLEPIHDLSSPVLVSAIQVTSLVDFTPVVASLSGATHLDVQVVLGSHVST